MNARLSRWAAGALVAGSLGLGVTGTAGAQSSETTFCADMTHVAKADAAAIQHPTEQDVHLLASGLDSASKALPTKAIVANRSQLASLIATNFLGHNTPAIAATESEYEQMWAQDVAAMFGSAGSLTSSSVDARVAPLARYVEHACPASVESLQRLDASEHLHLEDGPRTWP